MALENKNYEPARMQGGVDYQYSTSEYKTNRSWIDGKPIYGIVFEFTDANTGSTDLGTISDLDTVVSLNGYLTIVSGTGATNTYLLGFSDGTNSVGVRYTTSSGLFRLTTAALSADNVGKVVVEYTKK